MGERRKAAGARSLVQVAEDTRKDPAIPALVVDREGRRPGHRDRQEREAPAVVPNDGELSEGGRRRELMDGTAPL